MAEHEDEPGKSGNPDEPGATRKGALPLGHAPTSIHDSAFSAYSSPVGPGGGASEATAPSGNTRDSSSSPSDTSVR